MTGDGAQSAEGHDRALDLIQRLRDDEPRLGHLHAAFRYKQELVARMGVERAFQVARASLNVPGIDNIVRRRLVSLRAAVQRNGSMKELWPGGREFRIAAPQVIGSGDHNDYRGVSRSAYLGYLDNVLIRGRSSIALADSETGREAVVDHENNELDSFADNPELDPGILHADNHFYWTIEPASCATARDEAFMLIGKYTHDFGHWLTEYLPRLALAMMADLPTSTILIDERMPETHRESVGVLLPDAELVTVPHLAPCFVKRLWCASNPVYRGYYPSNWDEAWPATAPDPSNFAKAIRFIKQRMSGALEDGGGPERLYLARRPGRKKQLLNYEEIEATAREHGFAVLYPEDYSFMDQIRLVHRARYIVAPDGSNGLLSYFASPGASACFLNSTNTFPLVELNGLLGELGVSFTVVSGPMTGPDDNDRFWNDYSIDRAVFADFLSTWGVLEEPGVIDRTRRVLC